MKITLAIAILTAPVALWFFVIQPRLGGSVWNVGASLDGAWERFKARIYAFRTFVVGAIGYYTSEIPGALQAFGLLDISWMSADVRFYIGLATIAGMMLVRAYSTTPVNTPER
jgi:hypothetical protein